MWNDYQEKNGNNKVCYDVYRKLFEKEKITFGTPSQDECEICLKLEQHKKEHSEVENCEFCTSALEHQVRAKRAREEYEKVVTDGTESFSVHVQTVLLLPKLTTKEHLFVSRLVVFNETFAARNRKNPDFVILWHEAIRGRLAKDVASTFVKCIENVNEKM